MEPIGGADVAAVDAAAADPALAADPVVTPAVETPTNGVVTHVVGSGDTLYKLAGQYYGDASRWERIRDANKAALGGKIDLKLGTELVIP